MDNIQVNENTCYYIITVLVDKKRVENFIEALNEASKILQREVMRYERNNDRRFYR